jgi:hypothetical protein
MVEEGCWKGQPGEGRHGDVGVRMRNGVGKRESTRAPVCWCAHAERGLEARVLMGACMFACVCRMGLGSERAHGRLYVGVRMRNGAWRRESSWAPVCSRAYAEWGWEGRELMDTCNDGVRMRNGIGKRESSWTRVTMVCACGMGLGRKRADGHV